jgi:hypothetical protein
MSTGTKPRDKERPSSASRKGFREKEKTQEVLTEEHQDLIVGARHRWFMPVILATQEAEIRRITVRSQAGGIFQR